MAELKSAFHSTLLWAQKRSLQIEAQNTTGSTNDDAKKRAHQEGFEFVLYLAEHQTQGRGRGSNTWLDTGVGESFLGTWSFALYSSPQAITAPRIGLALFRAAQATWPSLPWSLKAPNDLFLNGKKVAGLLVETVSEGHRFRLLIGLGLNVINHPRSFSAATHLRESMGLVADSDWFRFLDAIKSEFSGALTEIVQLHLNEDACRQLKHALNSNSARPFDVTAVGPQGDIHHAKGHIPWTEI